MEQLEKVNGVKSAMANHTGTLVRAELTGASEAESVSSELASILEKQKRKARLLDDDEALTAIKGEQWRTAETIGELSEIEFRTVFSRRVQQYTEANDLGEETNTKLIRFSEEILSDTPKSDANTDWRAFCGGLAAKMLEKAKPLLTENQLDDLAKRLRARVLG